MNVFTIENESNNITVHASAEDAAVIENAVTFDSQAALAELAAEWPTGRLVEIWNSLPGITPVKKFTDRETAVRRIWGALQNLVEPAPVTTLADVAETTSDVAPVETGTGEEAGGEGGANVAPQQAKPRENKTEAVLALLRREGGVTAEELMNVTGWQAHSVRGFLSGTIRKKMGLALVSMKAEDGTRTYSVQG